MKEVIIVQHNGGRLANQLWIYAKIYSFCLENNYKCSNPSFYEYASYFNLAKEEKDNGKIEKTYTVLSRIFGFISNKYRREFFRRMYGFFTSIFLFGRSGSVIDATFEKINLSAESEDFRLKLFRESTNNKIYFRGWNFSNKSGLKKHQFAIQKLLQPKMIFKDQAIRNFLFFRKTYSHIVGVHIRHTDYASPEWKHLFISFDRAAEVLNEYLISFSKTKEDTLFIICSDTMVLKSKFEGLNVHMNKGSEIEDLATLSMCDAVIGSNSTYGAFASYLGNIPFIIMVDDNMDWEYYQKKTSFFCNKYSLLIW